MNQVLSNFFNVFIVDSLLNLDLDLIVHDEMGMRPYYQKNHPHLDS